MTNCLDITHFCSEVLIILEKEGNEVHLKIIDDRAEIEEKDEDEIVISWIAQGHLTNVADKPVDDVIIDISYYDMHDSFLGLDKSGFFDEDEIEPGGTMAFSVDLNIPDNTEKCIISISCKKMPTGVFMNWFYRGKG